MATYTITINERTREGKGLVNYLKTLGVIEVPNEKTRKAIQEIREGKELCAIHLRNILKQSNETQDYHFQPVKKDIKLARRRNLPEEELNDIVYALLQRCERVCRV